jgi:hypothetical protein
MHVASPQPPFVPRKPYHVDATDAAAPDDSSSVARCCDRACVETSGAVGRCPLGFPAARWG